MSAPRWLSPSMPALYILSRVHDGTWRPVLGCMLAGLMAAAPTADARVEILRTGIRASSTYHFGGSPQGPFQTLEVNVPVLPGPSGSTIAQADARIDIPSFTPPAGAPGDTFFLPATVHAFQRADGFNSTAVDASAAQGLLFNEFVASTLWEIDVLVTNPLGLPSPLTLDYMLFPGEVGVSALGTERRAAFVNTLIDIQQVSEVVPRIVSQSSLVLSRESGSFVPTLTASGDFSGASTSLTSEVRDGLRYDKVSSAALINSLNLGTVASGTTLTVRYVMSASVLLPGFELAGFASIGDPFELSNDGDGYIASQFPGQGGLNFAVRETAAPVPVPAAGMLFAGGVVLLVAGRRRMKAPPFTTAC